MLKRIKCTKLADNLEFHDGANYIVGDNKASNSIGKTTALLLIDFALGGTTYAQSEEIELFIGDHTLEIEFDFAGKQYFFNRSFESSEYVTRIGGDDKHKLSIKQYTDFLKAKYELEAVETTFRDIVSLYSRIWGKRNISPTKPLSTVPNESGSKAVIRLLKLYQKYAEIGLISQSLRDLKDERKTLEKAQAYTHLPASTKRAAQKAESRIAKIDAQIDAISATIAYTRESTEAALSPEILQLRKRRSELTIYANILEGKIERLESNLEYCHPTQDIHAQLQELRSFFPEANIKRIEDIEGFRDSVDGMLVDGIQEEISRLRSTLDDTRSAQSDLDAEFASLVEMPPRLKGEVHDFTRLIAERIENEQIVALHSKQTKINKDIQTEETNEEKEYEIALHAVSTTINQEILKVSSDVMPTAPPPSFTMTKNNYSYKIKSDSGTGRAYAALTIFDLAVLESTALPFFMHDSICLKNIELETLNNIIDRYNSIRGKQVFIAIDELQRLNEKQVQSVESRKVLSLSDSHTLFGAQWRRRDTPDQN